MTLEQVKEKYGNVKLKFSYYYKYCFAFSADTEDGEHVYASIGGNAGDIYRLEVDADKEVTINSLDPNHIAVSKDGKDIFEWNNW